MTDSHAHPHSHHHPQTDADNPAPVLADEAAIAELADLFHLLGDKTRLAIVLQCLSTPTAVSDIAQNLQASTSLVSHHLRLLRAARIVKAQRMGKQVFYSAADHHISDVLMEMLEHIAEPHDAGGEVAGEGEA